MRESSAFPADAELTRSFKAIRNAYLLSNHAELPVELRLTLSSLVKQRGALSFFGTMYRASRGLPPSYAVYLALGDRIHQQLVESEINLQRICVVEVAGVQLGEYRIVIPFAIQGEMRLLGSTSERDIDSEDSETRGFLDTLSPGEAYGYKLSVDRVPYLGSHIFEKDEEIPDPNLLKEEALRVAQDTGATVFTVAEESVVLRQPKQMDE